MELLVVIAIIGILLTLLLPSLQKARETARTAVCLSQLKQISISYMQYNRDNNNRTLLKKLKPNKMWMAKLYKYHSSREILKCPSTIHGVSSITGMSSDGSYWGSDRSGYKGGDGTWMTVENESISGSYGFNSYLYYNDNRYTSLNDILNPANTPAFTGSIWVDQSPNSNHSSPTHLQGAKNDQSQRILIDRHYSKKNNSLQVDGSAKSYYLKHTLQFEWYNNFNTRSITIP